ncbi:unnamed protein product [Musa acuminata subsp. burmannicoides]
MNSFWKYYSGQELAPVLTIYILVGTMKHQIIYGNCIMEAGLHLIYISWSFLELLNLSTFELVGFLGFINKGHYHLGHFERPPFYESDLRSVYHLREYDVMKLKHIKEPIDIFISHDWPVVVYEYGNLKRLLINRLIIVVLLQIKKRTLGSLPAAELLNQQKPHYLFSGHIHCNFTAAIQRKKDESITRFDALDKCVPGRKFLLIVDINSDPGPYEIQHDADWLVITRKFNSVFPMS